MSTHPSRSKKATPGQGGTPPSPKQIKAARDASGLTQTDAAHLIYSTLRTWQDWESGGRTMHPAHWELFNLKVLAMKASIGTHKEQ